MTSDEWEQREFMLSRFHRLIGELVHGELTRNTFAPWEIDLLLDFDACDLPPRRRTEILTQYERAVAKQVRSGSGPPMLLSHFLIQREQKRQDRSRK